MNDRNINVGPTTELSLRVSVATLSRVVFPHPKDGVPMLALEHKATLAPGDADSQVVVKAQPFGGAIRIINLERIDALVGGFNFDSERSRSERDFRIYIRPSSWEAIREFCLRNMGQDAGPDLEIDPSRELVEEFDDALGIQLTPPQYMLKPAGVVVENEPSPTANLRAAGNPTARIYGIDEVQIQDPAIVQLMMTNSSTHAPEVLRRLALDDARKGGPGRANAMLVAPVEQIRAAFLAVSPELRGMTLPFGITLLEGNVAALLNGISIPKYLRLP